ncbi:MAG: hypothetical protein C4345_00565 [Chloroflexota bacterium]
MRFWTSRALLSALLVALATGDLSAGAQEENTAADAAAPRYAAFVARGSCADASETPRLSLGKVTVASLRPQMSADTTEDQEPAVLKVALDTLLKEPHAIVVRKSVKHPTSTVACGEIAGTVKDGFLAIGLREIERSGYAGLARLSADGNKTAVTLFLTSGLTGTASAPDFGAVPAGGLLCCGGPPGISDAKDVSVTILDSLFLPGATQVQAGTTLTFENTGPSEHTVSIFRDGTLVADSGVLTAGQSFSYTFAEPGTYDYLCTLQPWMRATLIVVPDGEGAAA